MKIKWALILVIYIFILNSCGKERFFPRDLIEIGYIDDVPSSVPDSIKKGARYGLYRYTYNHSDPPEHYLFDLNSSTFQKNYFYKVYGHVFNRRGTMGPLHIYVDSLK